MSDEPRRTIKGWAARLSIDDELLTLDEARTLAQIATADKLTECLTALQDMQVRVQRFEMWAAHQSRALAERGT